MVSSLLFKERFCIHLIDYQVFKRLLEQLVRLPKLLDFRLLGLLSFLELVELLLLLLAHSHAGGLILMELPFRGSLSLDKLFLVLIHFTLALVTELPFDLILHLLGTFPLFRSVPLWRHWWSSILGIAHLLRGSVCIT